jgi:hypothetical protein
VKLPDAPLPGLVLSYSYLWADQAKKGKEEGLKVRPAAIVLARRDIGPSELVYVVPITHSPPGDGERHKIAIPAAVKKRLGLDESASWVDTTELNVFVWPGPDLRPIRDHHDANSPCFYGYLPTKLFDRIKTALALNYEERRVRAVARTE